MPELPEVEAARRAVQEHCMGKRIVKAIIADDNKVIEGVSPSEIQKALVGKKLIAAHRKGKNMWWQLDSHPFPTFQFGMTGAVHIKGVSLTKYKRSAVNDDDEWPSKFSKVFVEFDDGMELSFTDKRRFARVRLLENPEAVPPISKLGPDALLELMPEDDFIDALNKKGTPIKSLLLDQGFISGIGNWVADEVLYHARIHPLHIASTIPKEKCKSLHKCIKEVIEKALEVGADSSQYPENWIFHSREMKPGKAFVDGKKIDFIAVGSRTSAYVPDLQKLDEKSSGNQSARGGGNRSRKKTDMIESESLQSKETAEDPEEGKDKKGQRKRKTAKAGKTGLTASGAKRQKKGAEKVAEETRKRGGRKKISEIDSSEEIEAENTDTEQELQKEEETKEVKKRGKGQKSENSGMTETTASGDKGKRKRTNNAEVEKPTKKWSSNKANEVESPEQGDADVTNKDETDNPDASVSTSEKSSQAPKRKRGGKSN